MIDQAMIRAAMPPGPGPEINQQYKAEWNKFLDFIHSKGFRGNKDLDRRDQNLGRGLMDEYIRENPQTPINYDLVKAIQAGVAQDYEKMERIKALQGVRATDAGERPISPTDGWLGSMTSNMYFPKATTTDPKGRVVKDWGHDLDAYYQSLVGDQARAVPVISAGMKVPQK